MMMYEIESYGKKRNKKWIIIIVIAAVLVIGMAIFAGIKVAEKMAEVRANQENDAKGANVAQDEGNSGKEANGNNQGNNQGNSQASSQVNGQENNQANNQGSNQESNQGNNQTQSNGANPNAESNGQSLTKEQLQAIENIYDIEEKVAFLTFDDGPSTQVTPKILDILKQENIKATFFVLGTMVKANPEILKRERAEGHYIANHGYSHVYNKVYADENKPLEEYNKANKLIQTALEDGNYQSNVFRFPGGSVGGYYDKVKTKAKKKLQEKGIAYLDWNCLTNDADGADTKSAIMKNLKSTSKGKKSVVILMHDAPNKDLTAKTLPDVISYLREKGYNFKSLYDVL